MNILILCPTYPPEVGAAPSRIANMAEGLVARGHSVDVVCGLPNYPTGKIFPGYRGRFRKKLEQNGVKQRRYWLFASHSSNPVARIANMFSLAVSIWAEAFAVRRVRKLDLVVLQTPPLPLAVSGMALFKKLFRKKVVLNVSDIWPLTAVELGAMREGSAPHRLMSWMERYLYKNADAFQYQSREIGDEIDSFACTAGRPKMLYRNLQKCELQKKKGTGNGNFRIVYAGLLGIAQDVAGIIRNIDFGALGVEFHVYGSGVQADEIAAMAEQSGGRVQYHGSMPKQELQREMTGYDAAVVPLGKRISGAVPSKIYDLSSQGIPVLFCGGGEGAGIVKEKELGLVSSPGDHESLAANIRQLKEMPAAEIERMGENGKRLSQTEFSFERQLDAYDDFIKKLAYGK